MKLLAVALGIVGSFGLHLDAPPAYKVVAGIFANCDNDGDSLLDKEEEQCAFDLADGVGVEMTDEQKEALSSHNVGDGFTKV